MLPVFLLALMAVMVILLIIILVSVRSRRGDHHAENAFARLGEKIDGSAARAERESHELRREMNEAWRGSMQTQSEELRRMSDRQAISLQEMAEKQDERLAQMQEKQNRVTEALIRENAAQREAIIETLITSIDKLQTSNERRLKDIQGVVDEKLDKTLNERLDANFAQVTEQLGHLYKSLGELKDLSGGVQDLNRTLSNVKTRGTWGEIQLGRILAETMSRSQYDVNVATKRNSRDRVEFAVKFPSQDTEGEWVYMPIDAKFPADIYNRIVDAAANNDKPALEAATTELKTRIKNEAASIATKYLDPPRTTNFAFMYLPTEGLYAEVLRIDGLTEECQRRGVIITGPTTITAVLNNLQVVFRNLALSKKSVEVMRLLEAVKAQIGRMDAAVEQTRKKLSDAVTLTDDLKKRTARLSGKMKSLDDMDEVTADNLLGLTGLTDGSDLTDPDEI
ncbi:MAG: DNA recombination protein RmuC [Lachnospiraceae bacterium]|nr:DNA recombination protein RmuC [Lachnospiraceae bacterium]